MVGERWIMTGESIMLPEVDREVVRAVIGADDDDALARKALAAAVRRAVPAAALKVSAPWMAGICRAPDRPVARTSCFGRSISVSPSRSTVTVHWPVASS